MSDHECKTCNEYRQISRRNFVGISATLAAAAVAPGWLPRVVYADSENSARDSGPNQPDLHEVVEMARLKRCVLTIV